MKFTQTVGVIFSGASKEYSFITSIPDLERGDTVVVDTTIGLQIGKVASIHENRSALAERWVVCKVDLQEVNYRKEISKRRSELKRKIYKKRSEFTEIEVLKLMARENPEMEQLLVEYEELIGG